MVNMMSFYGDYKVGSGLDGMPTLHGNGTYAHVAWHRHQLRDTAHMSTTEGVRLGQDLMPVHRTLLQVRP